MTRTLLLAAIACASAAGCGVGQGDAAHGATVRDSAGIRIVENLAPRLPPGSWRLSAEPLVEISGDGPVVEEVPLDPVGIVSGANGEILVGDGNQVGWHAILAYDSTGTFLRKMGGRGDGPGEFRGQLWSVVPYRGDSVAAWDRRIFGVHIYGPDGGWGRDVILPQPPIEVPDGVPSFTPEFVGALGDGSFVSASRGRLDIPSEPGPAWFRRLLLHVPQDGSAYDTIGDFEFAQFYHWDGQGPTQTALPHSVHEIAYGDELLRASTSRYEYEVRALDGQVRLIVRRTVEPVPTTDAEIDRMVEDLRARAGGGGQVSEEQMAAMVQRMRDAPRPATLPVHSELLADGDGNVWVERYRWYNPTLLAPDPLPSTWDVFSPEGEWITEVVVPARVILRAVDRDRAFGVRIDEVDVKHIVVYGIERGGG